MANHFKLTLDTLAPKGSISANRYYKENGVFNVVKDDATKMAVWFDEKEIGVREDAPEFIAAADTFATAFVTDGNYYAHLVLMDDVGNESEVYNSSVITYDATLPTVSVSINNGDSFTTKQEVDVEVTFADNLSGVVSVELTNEIENVVTHTLTEEEIAAGKVVLKAKLKTLTAEEGEEGALRSVIATVTDAAGNKNESSDRIELDIVPPSGSLYLKTAAGDANLPEFVNSVDFAVEIVVDDAHSDVVNYSLTGDFVGAPKTGKFEAMNNKMLITGLQLTEGDGLKTIKGTITDEAGNVYQLAEKTVNLAQKVGTVSIASDKNYISKVDGFTTAVVTVTAEQGSAAFASWELKSGETVVKSGVGAPPATIEVTTTDAPFVTEGAYELKLFVTDVATSVIESEAITLTADFTGPVASEITVNAWYKETSGFVASAADSAAGMATMQAWISQKANDENATGEVLDYAATGASDTSKFDWTAAAQSDKNYVHIKYIDKVGNVTFAHSVAFGYDNVAPGAGSISIPAFTNTPSINATISYNDATSGIEMMKVWGDIEAAATEIDAEWVSASTSYSVTLTAGDGNKTVYVKFKDVAGNESVEPYASTTGELDQTSPSATLALYKEDGITVKPAHSALATLSAHVSGGDDADIGAAIQYKIYGDFTFEAQSEQGITEESAEWKTLNYELGQGYALVSNMFVTKGDGLKSIYLKVKDNAGNISSAAVQSFTYDTTAPTVVVSDVDYNRISKIHTLRSDSTEKYNDETRFTFTPDSAMQAYKVCAYADQASAEGGSSADAAIPTDAGSVNMAATGLNSTATVNAKIMGADLEAASAGDGLKIVVVYVQDLAGTWSIAAKFTV